MTSHARAALTVAVVTAGSSESSSTRLLADRTAAAAVEAANSRGLEVEAVQIDLRRIASEITSALTTGVISGDLAQAVAALAVADGLIVSTPVYNAGPSGLFTSFFQAIDDDLLIAKPVILAATAASPRHALVVDGQMRPMFAYLRTLTVPTSLFAAAEDWNNRELGSRIDRAAMELILLMESEFSKQVRDISWSRYRHEFGSTADDGIDFDSDMMKLAAGGSLTGPRPARQQLPRRQAAGQLKSCTAAKPPCMSVIVRPPAALICADRAVHASPIRPRGLAGATPSGTPKVPKQRWCGVWLPSAVRSEQVLALRLQAPPTEPGSIGGSTSAFRLPSSVCERSEPASPTYARKPGCLPR